MAAQEVQMIFSEFWIGLAIPFTFCQEIYPLLGEDGQEGLLPECNAIELDERVFNDYGRKTFQKRGRGMPAAKGFEIADNGSWRTDVGLSRDPKENYIFYFSETDTCPIRFDKFKLYFFKTGNGFLMIETSVQDIDYKHILDLKYSLTFIPGTGVTNPNIISYWKANGEQVRGSFTIQKLAERCLAWADIKPIDKGRCYALTGGLLPQTVKKEELLNFMDLLCLTRPRSRMGRLTEENRREMKLSVDDELFYVSSPESPYIYWETSEHTIVFVGDIQNAMNERNQNFLISFKNKLFSHYAYIYLYYLELLLELDDVACRCNDIEEAPEYYRTDDIQKIGKDADNIKIRNKELCDNTSYNHINKLFGQCLCGDSLQIQKKLDKISELCDALLSDKKRGSIFISYRREGGVYLALLIFKFLKQVGRDVFFDLKSMHAGAFDEQLYTKIDEASHVIAVISKGSMERCIQSEEDWVRKELTYAFEKKKQVIPLWMDDFDGFEGLELPNELKKITAMQSIKIHPAYFDIQMEELLEYLNRS